MEPESNFQTYVQDLKEAIQNRKRVSLVYNGTMRLVEPQCLGIAANGNILLRAYQISPAPAMNKLFTIAPPKLGLLSVRNESFYAEGPNYRRGDSAMKKILCEL